MRELLDIYKIDKDEIVNIMRSVVCAFIAIFLFIGCNKRKSASVSLLDNVERAIRVNPDSAQILLDRISDPEKLNNKSFARWCMLSGMITDLIYNTLLPAEQFERAYKWYSAHGIPVEQAKILIYLGRSYAEDGDYDKAMSIYTDAIDIAEKNTLCNLSGYAYSYMGDLYQKRIMKIKATDKYKVAANYFKKAGNTKSYACALRDIGYGYVCMDSIDCAMNYLLMADSVAANLQNQNVKASIANVLGNTYLINGDYEKAKECFSKALRLGRNKLPNYVALIELYIKSDSITVAKEFLKKIPTDNPQYMYSIKNLSYQIYKKEKNYEAALAALEECNTIVDSVLDTTNKSKIVNIETKYNNLKIKEKVKSLQIRQQHYIIILTICLSIILLGIIGYLLYRKKVEKRFNQQQIKLSHIMIEMIEMSNELEKKKNLLATFTRKNDKYLQMEEEIAVLSKSHMKLQTLFISNSLLYKELRRLANQDKPQYKLSLLTENHWKKIVHEITTVYPNFYSYIYELCPDLTEADFEYCCLIMYGFDTNEEATLLNITPNSASKKRLRLRQKLNLSLPEHSSLYKYLIEKMN